MTEESNQTNEISQEEEENEFMAYAFDEEMMPKYLQQQAKLEDMIFTLSYDQFNEIKELAQQNNVENNLLFKLIIQATNVRPFRYKLYGDFWLSLPQTKTRFYSTKFLEYLIQREVVHESQILSKSYVRETAQQLEDVFPRGSFAHAIINDDLDNVLFLTTDETCMHQIIEMDKEKLLPITLAAYAGALQVFRYFIMNNVKIQQQSLQKAVLGGNLEIIELISQQGFSFKDFLNDSILSHQNDVLKWIISEYGISTLSPFFCLNAYNTLAFWISLDLSKDPNIRDSDGKLLITKAIENDQYEIVKYCFSMGAVPMNESLDTAIKLGQLSIVELFLDSGYPIQDVHPLLVAIDEKKDNIAKCLIERGVPVDISNEDSDTPLIKAIEMNMSDIALLLIKKGANIEAVNWKKDSVLMLAIEMSLSEVAIELINKGAKISSENLFGDTPLIKAIDKHLWDVSDLLVEKGENVNQTTIYGSPLITICTKHNQLKLLKKLVAHGADIDAVDENDQTSLLIAEKNGLSEIVEYLKSIKNK